MSSFLNCLFVCLFFKLPYVSLLYLNVVDAFSVWQKGK